MREKDRQELKSLILETLKEWDYERKYKQFAGKTVEKVSHDHTKSQKKRYNR